MVYIWDTKDIQIEKGVFILSEKLLYLPVEVQVECPIFEILRTGIISGPEFLRFWNVYMDYEVSILNSNIQTKNALKTETWYPECFMISDFWIRDAKLWFIEQKNIDFKNK